LPRRACEDLKTGFQRIFGLGECESRLAALEQLVNSIWKLLVHLFERREQAFATLRD
jgi:hypothetical protein